MGLTMSERQARKRKGRILDEVVALTGYNRWYVVGLLRWDGKVIRVGRRVRLVGDLHKKVKRTRHRLYGEAELGNLMQIWAIMDYICGKRLAAILPEVIPIQEKHREIVPDAITRQKPLQISASTIDRLLAAERRKWMLRGRSGTKPGTLLKHQIPIHTFADWNEKRAGFVEIDLVGHGGGGDCCQTLDVTDVASTWTEA